MAITIDMTDQVVLVTGGVRGVGLGVTRAFIEAGARVVACARHAPPELPEGAEFASADVRDPDQVERLIAGIACRHGRLDVAVNNAGGSPYLPTAEADPRRHAKIIELNLTAPLIVARAANAVMQGGRDGGSILMISSVSGHRASPGTAAYGAAKAGLDNLVSSLAVEWAPKVRVNSLVVGLVHTELAHLHYGDADGIASVAATVPAGRLADPLDVGHCCVLLASPLASYVSGSCLPVHGGGERPAFRDAANVNNEDR